jgi:D-glycero-D-manno-heptose 1,7-bisphosphate phosphatase
MNERRALFLDRDGVINVDHTYVYKREHFQFIEGIFDICRFAKQKGYLLFVITNQAGIGRGFYTEEDFHQLTDWMNNEFRAKGVIIDKVFFCPFHPEHGIGRYKVESPDRKPGPGMILRALEEYSIDPARSVLVGDKESDIQAGKAAGVSRTLLYLPSSEDPIPRTAAYAVVRRLGDVSAYL